MSPVIEEHKSLLPTSDLAMPRLTPSHYKTLGLSTLGGGLEYYEFIVFLYVSPILSTLMFPPGVPAWIRQLQILGIFAVGYIARPIGGLLLGALGDSKGRKKMFSATLILIAGPTFGIGILPTYAQVGALAPALLLLCRILQGVAIGGELPAAATFVAEHVPPRRHGLALGMLGGAFVAGALLAVTILMVLNRSFNQASMLSVGWRIPFLFGGIAGFASAHLRRFVKESPVFAEMMQRKEERGSNPLRMLFKDYYREMLCCMLASACLIGVIASTTMFPLTYMQTELRMHASVVTAAQAWMLLGVLLGAVMCGWMTDHIGVLRALFLFSVILALSTYITYHHPREAGLSHRFFAIGLSAGYTTSLYRLPIDCFPACIRVTGFSFTYNVAGAVVGGLVPIVMGYLCHWNIMALVYVPIFFSSCGLIAVWYARGYKKPLAN